jgi:hypothetical protein
VEILAEDLIQFGSSLELLKLFDISGLKEGLTGLSLSEAVMRMDAGTINN